MSKLYGQLISISHTLPKISCCRLKIVIQFFHVVFLLLLLLYLSVLEDLSVLCFSPWGFFLLFFIFFPYTTPGSKDRGCRTHVLQPSAILSYKYKTNFTWTSLIRERLSVSTETGCTEEKQDQIGQDQVQQSGFEQNRTKNKTQPHGCIDLLSNICICLRE